MKASDPGYPFPVVYSTESGDYRRATVTEVDQQLHAQAHVASDYRKWRSRSEPDKLDRIWANYLEMVCMVERAPFPPKHSARSWDLRGGRKTSHVPAESVLEFVGRDPSNFTWSDRVQW